MSSPNMNLPIPAVGTTPGPLYATNLDSCLTIIDGHNHTPGYGVQIPVAGLNINADLPMNDNNLISIRTLRLQVQPSTPVAVTDLDCLYVTGVDLYYIDGSGNNVRITQSGGVAGSPGSIAGLASPASATYVSASSTFVWQSNVNTPANLDAASILLRNLVSGSDAVTLNPPASLSSNYSLQLPLIPAAQSFLAIDTSGNIFPYVLTNDGITGSNIEVNVNLQGDAVQENGKNVVVSNTNTTNSLSIIRVWFGGTGSVLSGEGATAVQTSPGQYTITYTTAFSDTPATCVTAQDTGSPLIPTVNTPSSTGCKVFIYVPGGGTVQQQFFFIAIGQRA